LRVRRRPRRDLPQPRLAAQRQPADERLEQTHAERERIDGRARRLAAQLLGCRVRPRAGDRTIGRFVHEPADDTEIQQHDTAILDEDVRRLDVAMDETGGVQRRQPERELAQRPAQRTFVECRRGPLGWVRRRHDRIAADCLERTVVAPRQRRRRAPLRAIVDALADAAPHVVEEVRPAHELHREQPRAGDLDELAERDQVRVVDVAERAKLALEIEDALRADLDQRLERDRDPALAVEHFVDAAHATAAERREVAKARGRREALGRDRWGAVGGRARPRRSAARLGALCAGFVRLHPRPVTIPAASRAPTDLS
jgi:hypothetical protein